MLWVVLRRKAKACREGAGDCNAPLQPLHMNGAVETRFLSYLRKRQWPISLAEFPEALVRKHSYMGRLLPDIFTSAEQSMLNPRGIFPEPHFTAPFSCSTARPFAAPAQLRNCQRVSLSICFEYIKRN